MSLVPGKSGAYRVPPSQPHSPRDHGHAAAEAYAAALPPVDCPVPREAGGRGGGGGVVLGRTQQHVAFAAAAGGDAAPAAAAGGAGAHRGSCVSSEGEAGGGGWPGAGLLPAVRSDRRASCGAIGSGAQHAHHHEPPQGSSSPDLFQGENGDYALAGAIAWATGGGGVAASGRQQSAPPAALLPPAGRSLGSALPAGTSGARRPSLELRGGAASPRVSLDNKAVHAPAWSNGLPQQSQQSRQGGPRRAP